MMKHASVSCLAVLSIFLGAFLFAHEAFSAAIPNGPIYKDLFEYRFMDGVKIKVHYSRQILKQSGETNRFARDVLDAAVEAYQIITQFQGFSSIGYTFAYPDKSYAYDPDRTIDIYIGGVLGDEAVLNQASHIFSFKDAPCFDTIKLSDTQYEAVILLPSNYREFIKNWERINPSSLGVRNISVDLRGTLIHEMLHVILFYYNKNLNKDNDDPQAANLSADGKVDWYVEGLARYFETFAGARHDFFSQGFKQTLPDKIRFSRGGANYFMRYPDQAFTDLRYENALFWRFVDYHYGMAVIERISKDLRNHAKQEFVPMLERATQTPFNELLKTFAMSILFNDFGLKEDTIFLKAVARTHLVYKNKNFYLVDGAGNQKYLGRTCRTDWIGKWENASAAFGESAVAGDSTEKADVSGWATDYLLIDLDSNDRALPGLSVTHTDGGSSLTVQWVAFTKGGSLLTKDLGNIKQTESAKLDLRQWIGTQHLRAQDIEKIILLIANTDPHRTADYEVTVSP